ncbi:MAG TPA: hypothetical protein ENH95_08605, partial [Nitrosopumilus sp.]|nr:hypothetical protein [Nitrosopumilus sp.]
MNIPKTPETAEGVRKLYLYGHSTEEISNSCKVSTGYVSGIATKLKEQLGSKEVTAIRELTRLFNKLEISAANAFDGARIFSMLKNFEIKVDDFPAFLKEVYQKCKEENISPSTLAHQCKALTQLQAKSNIPLQDLSEECTRLIDTKNELEKKISQLEEEAAKANADAANALSEKNQTTKSLEEFEQTKKELDNFELGFNNLSKLINALKKAADAGYNIDKIIKHLEKEGSYEQRIAELEQQVKQLRAQETILTRRVNKLSKTIETKKLLVVNVRRLEKIGIKVEDLETMYETVIGIAKENHMDEKAAIQKLENDLRNNYHKKHGLESHLKELQNNISIKSTELESIQVKIENFNIKNNENEQALNILKTLKQKGIDPFLILTWNKILETSSLKPKMFEEKLLKYSSVRQIINAEQQNLKQLTKERKELESNIEFLKSNKEKLESTIKYGNELIKKSLDDNVLQTVEQLKNTAEIANNSIRTFKDNA